MKNSNKNSGGLWMVVGLVAILVMPLVVDHFVRTPSPDPVLHADASVN